MKTITFLLALFAIIYWLTRKEPKPLPNFPEDWDGIDLAYWPECGLRD